MLQLQVLSQDPEWVKERLTIKNFKDVQLVDSILELNEQRKKYTFQYDETKALINAASKLIGQLMAKGDKAGAEEKKKEVEQLKTTLTSIEPLLSEVEKELHNQLVQLPNLPAKQDPPGNTPEENEDVSAGGKMPKLPEQA